MPSLEHKTLQESHIFFPVASKTTMEFKLTAWIGIGTELCPTCGLEFTVDLYPVVGAVSYTHPYAADEEELLVMAVRCCLTTKT